MYPATTDAHNVTAYSWPLCTSYSDFQDAVISRIDTIYAASMNNDSFVNLNNRTFSHWLLLILLFATFDTSANLLYSSLRCVINTWIWWHAAFHFYAYLLKVLTADIRNLQRTEWIYHLIPYLLCYVFCFLNDSTQTHFNIWLCLWSSSPVLQSHDISAISRHS